MLGADIIAKILAKEEIEFVAGFPENRVFDSAAALGIRPLIARSERVATNIADGFSRMTNGKRIGVVAVQEGPGAEAAFAAVAQAYGDASPILMIPGSYDRPLQGIDPYFDVGRSYRAISKLSLVVNDSDALVPAFRRAFGALRRGKGGPVVVSPTHDLLYEDVPDEEPNYRPPKTLRSAADRADVVEIAKVLAGAKRPVVIAGQGILYAEAWDELRELAEFMEIPVMTTLNGKSAFPENHMLALGAGGLSRPRMVDHFLSKSDFVLGIGTSLTVSDYITPIPPKKTIGQITNEPADVGKFYDVEVAAIGDAKLVLRQLIDACISRLGENGRRGEMRTGQDVKSVKEEYMAEWLPRLTSDEVPISPYRVIWEVMNTVDRSRTVITHDSGNPRDQIVPFYEAIVPRGYLGWGKSTQLGTGMGLVMGAKLAQPDWLAINMMGDAAIGMVGMDFESAARLGIPIMTVVLNNGVMGGYEQFMPTAIDKYAAHRMSGRYAQLAEALGGYAETVQRPDELRPAITRCIDRIGAGQPALLEVITREEPTFPRGG